MAHLELSKLEADLLRDHLERLTAYPDLIPPGLNLSQLLRKLAHLHFNEHACLQCGTVFEAINPRKTTCSDACRQALSRSKRDKPLASPGSHTKAVTPEVKAEPPPEVEPVKAPAEPKQTFPDQFTSLFPQRTQVWETIKADAKTVGCKTNRVQQFKADNSLAQGQPLSVSAQQLLKNQIENEQRETIGEARALQQRLERLKERATPERLKAIRYLVEGGVETPFGEGLLYGFDKPTNPTDVRGYLVSFDIAKSFLLDALESVGIKRRQKLVKGVWVDLENLIPIAKNFPLWGGENMDHCHGPKVEPALRCLFWGAAIRLATLEGEPPQYIFDFLDWCGIEGEQWWSNLNRVKAGKLSAKSDRTLLGLPTEGNLTKQAIKAAYNAAAKKAHPDLGGSAELMIRINDAREHLMVGAA